MWNYVKNSGLDVIAYALLNGIVLFTAASSLEDKPLVQRVVLVGGLTSYGLYITKAWEAKTTREAFAAYKAKTKELIELLHNKEEHKS